MFLFFDQKLWGFLLSHFYAFTSFMCSVQFVLSKVSLTTIACIIWQKFGSISLFSFRWLFNFPSTFLQNFFKVQRYFWVLFYIGNSLISNNKLARFFAAFLSSFLLQWNCRLSVARETHARVSVILNFMELLKKLFFFLIKVSDLNCIKLFAF